MKNILRLVLILALSISAPGADIQKLLHETQRMAHTPKEITMVWWIPTEFWDAVLQNNPQVSAEKRSEFTKVLNAYMVIAVISADVGPMGGINPRSREKIIENAELKVGEITVLPLKKSEISADARNFVDLMKPMMANMLGQFGQGMEFLIYPNPVAGGEKVEASKSGAFIYTMFGHRFDWKLPLGSLLPPKFDAKTKQEFPGDYLFNPYSGEKLSEK